MECLLGNESEAVALKERTDPRKARQQLHLELLVRSTAGLPIAQAWTLS